MADKVNELIRELRDEYLLDRKEVAQTLGKIGDKRAIKPLHVLSKGKFLGIGKMKKNPNVRKAAKQALEKIEQRAKGEPK